MPAKSHDVVDIAKLDLAQLLPARCRPPRLAPIEGVEGQVGKLSVPRGAAFRELRLKAERPPPLFLAASHHKEQDPRNCRRAVQKMRDDCWNQTAASQ